MLNANWRLANDMIHYVKCYHNPATSHAKDLMARASCEEGLEKNRIQASKPAQEGHERECK